MGNINPRLRRVHPWRSVPCPVCGRGVGMTCHMAAGQYAVSGVHTERQALGEAKKRAERMEEIKKELKRK